MKLMYVPIMGPLTGTLSPLFGYDSWEMDTALSVPFVQEISCHSFSTARKDTINGLEGRWVHEYLFVPVTALHNCYHSAWESIFKMID